MYCIVFSEKSLPIIGNAIDDTRYINAEIASLLYFSFYKILPVRIIFKICFLYWHHAQLKLSPFTHPKLTFRIYVINKRNENIKRKGSIYIGANLNIDHYT